MNGDVRVTALPPVSEAATDRYERLCLSIAGIGFELAWAGAPPAQERSLKFYREFLSDRGEGLVVIGRSGAGTCTLANLYKRYKGVTNLGDERVIATKEEGRFWLSGTPWPGGAFRVSGHRVPLRKIFFLEHGSCNALIGDARLTHYGLLFQQLFLPFWHGEALGFAVNFAHELIAALPAHRL